MAGLMSVISSTSAILLLHIHAAGWLTAEAHELAVSRSAHIYQTFQDWRPMVLGNQSLRACAHAAELAYEDTR
jgi:hypothetical protein